jgi:predicted metal-dependent hydrolase
MITFDYQVFRRPRRKTAYISVNPDCSVRILVPSALTDEKIIELVNRKSRWIRTKIAHFQEINHNQKQREYVSGESFTYLGRNYRLKINSGGMSETVKLMNGRFNIYLPPEITDFDRERFVVDQLTSWYKERAIIRLRQKTVRYAKQLGVVPVSVGLRDYKSQWGSCQTDGKIYYNWKIIIAPHSIVDYVAVHELCHLVYHDHSKQFWKLLETIIPDYIKRKKWLKVNGVLLDV